MLKELVQQEFEFHWPYSGKDRTAIENMLDESFWEVGASGKRYDREHAIQALVERAKNPSGKNAWKTQDFECLEISPNSYLLTYMLVQGERVTRRATIWRHVENTWKVLYHQGTIVRE